MKGKLAEDSAAIASALLQSGQPKHVRPVRIVAMRPGETQEQARARADAIRSRTPRLSTSKPMNDHQREWAEAILSNDETSTDQELVDQFMENGLPARWQSPPSRAVWNS